MILGSGCEPLAADILKDQCVCQVLCPRPLAIKGWPIIHIS